MTAAAARKHAATTEPLCAQRFQPSALDVFAARCEARALLWRAAEIDWHDAVDEMQAAAAVRDGLVDSIGQDAVQEILSQAFARVR